MDFGPIADQLIASAIVGIFTLGAGVILHRKKGGQQIVYIMPAQPSPLSPPNPNPANPANQPHQMNQFAQVFPTPANQPQHYAAPPPAWGAYPQPKAPSVSVGRVLIHVAVLQFLGNIVGLLTGLSIGLLSVSIGLNATSRAALISLLILLLGTATLIIGFFIIGLRVDPAIRWRHLFYVAIGTGIATIVVNLVVGYRPGNALELFVAIIVAFVQGFIAMGIGGGFSMLFNRASSAPSPVYPQQAAPYYPQPPIGYVNASSTPIYPPAPGQPQYPPAPPNQPNQLYPQYPQHPQYPPQQPGNHP